MLLFVTSTDNNDQFDIAVGNPPWINYSDLPDSYKTKAGECFLKHGLVKSRRDVLLGASRADMASVIIQKCIAEHIRDRGKGYFFIPASLLFNEDANKHFRPKVDCNNVFRIDELYSFDIGQVFEDVKVRSCLVAITLNYPHCTCFLQSIAATLILRASGDPDIFCACMTVMASLCRILDFLTYSAFWDMLPNMPKK